ncbi:MAG: peptidyl-prolyl cis-trans isomerase [Chloroflexota bacterium]
MILIHTCLLLTALTLALSSCNLPGAPAQTATPPGEAIGSQAPTPGDSAGQSQTPAVESQVPVQPSPTPLPLAARVNGSEISLAEYEAGLAQYRQANGKAPGADLAAEEKQRVLDALIDEALLAQAAAQAGFTVDEALLGQRMQQLSDTLGGQPALQAWMTANGYDDAGFRQALGRSIAAAWQRDRLTEAVPQTAEQVHVRQILVYNAGSANDALAQVQAGNSFANLAAKYDPITLGDLGWFPRGYLLDAQLEQAAFALQPGQTSGVVQTAAGYHILQVLERDPQRPLTPEARRAMQVKAVQSWLAEQRAAAKIEVLI